MLNILQLYGLPDKIMKRIKTMYREAVSWRYSVKKVF